MKFRWIGMSQDGNEIKLNKFSGNFNFKGSKSSKVKRWLVVDTETTGFDSTKDKIIEIGIRPFTYNSDERRIVSAENSYSSFSDPGFKLPENITKITGISDAQLKGRSIDWNIVKDYFDDADIIVAHNATFDRPFIDKNVNYSETVWACSWSQINWLAKGFPKSSLDLLTIYHGFYGDAHRAAEDADLLLHLLSFSPPNQSSSYFSELLVNSHTPYRMVLISNLPYEHREEIKKFRFRWDSKNKLWYRLISSSNYRNEEIHLITEVCNKRGAKITEKSVPLSDNFKSNF